VCGCQTCADSLDGRLISDVERQFLKNWKAMRNPELRLMAPPGDSACVTGSPPPSAGTMEVAVSSAGTQQQSMSVVSARQSTSEPTNARMSMVPCSSVSIKQQLYYDSQLHVFCVVIYYLFLHRVVIFARIVPAFLFISVFFLSLPLFLSFPFPFSLSSIPSSLPT